MARAKSARAMDHGVPLFLEQLVQTLRSVPSTTVSVVAGQEPALAPTEIGRTAAAHGVEMMRHGYTVDQVVYHYGDVCQAITELAVEMKVSITAHDFHTFNRCLDNAIADAVTSFASSRKAASDAQALALHESLNTFSSEQRLLIDIAGEAVATLRRGDMKMNGATGLLLTRSLEELGILSARVTPGIRLASAIATLT